MESDNSLRVCSMLLIVFLLNSCATPSKLSPEDLKSLSPNEGIAIGSLIIRGGDDPFGRTEWKLIAKNDNDSGMFPDEYSVIANRDGEEKIFALSMPAGSYTFFVLSQSGFGYSAKKKIELSFSVQPNKPVYIGRIVVEFPPGLITIYTNIRYKVDIAQGDIAERVKSSYGIDLVETNSSIVSSGSTRPTAYQFSSQWVSITSGGMMAFPGTGPALALNLANGSSTPLDVTVFFKAPDHKQQCEVTKQIGSNSSTFFQCPQTSIATNTDYPISITIHALGESGKKKLVETTSTKFNFSKKDAEAFEQLRKALQQ
ncbi:hypothetical protein EYC98_15375 [Halieaceae bacterium IMCC14734]|uniref:Uncharacterized protein n=1 Tax=Candidatus Litorirhabdus singularis TaxID=2518993 RepID=A0ABT3TIT1_9GAMM|nr:hypothetical protein [Candidatus Litorirhabdus singularis]MCX2982242.1 hypothetical protein [Candidatus Litorirhabdus singularis]